MKNLVIITISILALAVMPGCDSDSSGSGTNTNTDGGTSTDTTGGGTAGTGFTGLDGSLAMSDLTDEQQIAACEAGDAWLMANHDHDEMTKARCVMSGMMAGMMGSTCQEGYDACMENPEPMEADDCAEEVDDLSACTEVTVAETEACIMAQWAQQMEMMTQLAAMTCEDIEAAMAEPDEDPGMMEDDEIPAECEGLEEKCPAFFADDEDMPEMDGDMDMDDM